MYLMDELVLVLRYYLAGAEVRMLAQLVVHALQADGVGHVAHCQAGLVQDGDDPFMGLLHQVHYDLVVEVVNLEEERTVNIIVPSISMKAWIFKRLAMCVTVCQCVCVCVARCSVCVSLHVST